MGIRVNRLLTELNIGFATLEDVLKALGYQETPLTTNTKLSDEIANLVIELFTNEKDFLNLVDTAEDLKGYLGNIDYKGGQSETLASTVLGYSDNPSFWISELALSSPDKKHSRIKVGAFGETERQPLYSVLIGTNGVGKSMLMKEIVDFFVDLHAYVNNSVQRVSSANKGRLRGIGYHIDGAECVVVRHGKGYLTTIDKHVRPVRDLRLPSIVACHFGAFDKFPTQKVNGTAQTRYDVACYKYVGAHVNGSIISSSAIAFRLLFALNERMDDRQRENIRSILDFIGYDHRVSLSYTMVMKSRKDGTAQKTIRQRVDKDYANLGEKERNEKSTQLDNFYKKKTSTGNNQFTYDIEFDDATDTGNAMDELQYIYKLKQCDLVNNNVNVIFHKHGHDITSDDMSSGEFAMLSTVLSVTAAANDPHTLILLDEPELSLHPNWQMTLIDNLDRALKNQACHLMIATHSHMLVSDLPMKRASVTQIEKTEDGGLESNTIAESTYGWSAEEVLLKVFKTATDRNRYFGERIGKLLEQMGNNTISPKEVKEELGELQEISMHLSDVDPMKMILNTIVETYK